MQNESVHSPFSACEMQSIDQGRPVRILYRGGFRQLVNKCVLTQLIRNIFSNLYFLNKFWIRHFTSVSFFKLYFYILYATFKIEIIRNPIFLSQ